MKNRLFSVVLCLIALTTSTIDLNAQKNGFGGNYDFDVEFLGSEMDGSITLKVWGNGRNRFDAVAQAKKNAVYAVIFNGIRGNTVQSNLKPLLNEVNAEDKYPEYFQQLFSDKTKMYLKFISMRDERIEKTIFRRRETNTGGVSYGVIVRVLRSELREDLIKNNILKGQ